MNPEEKLTEDYVTGGFGYGRWTVMPHDTRHFAEELDELKQRLLVMGGLAEEPGARRPCALVERATTSSSDVIGGDEGGQRASSRDRRSLFPSCWPCTSRWRPTSAASWPPKINNDLERVGDLAVNIAEAAERYVSHPPVKPLIDLPRMATLAQKDAARGARRLRPANVGAAKPC